MERKAHAENGDLLALPDLLALLDLLVLTVLPDLLDLLDLPEQMARTEYLPVQR